MVTTATLLMTGEIDDTRKRGGGDAGTAEDHPSRITRGAGWAVFIYRDTRIGIRVERQIGSSTRGTDNTLNVILISRSVLISAGTAASTTWATTAGLVTPGGLRREIAREIARIAVDLGAPGGNYVRGNARPYCSPARIAGSGKIRNGRSVCGRIEMGIVEALSPEFAASPTH